MSLTVTAASGSGGFELSAEQSNSSQAGTFTAGNNSAVGTSGGIQYIFQTATSTSWAFTWTPPATDVGNIVMNLAGVSGGQIFANSYTLTPAAGGTGSTLTVAPSALTFTSNGGAAPPAQTFQVTSTGSAVAFTTGVSTTSGSNWLSAVPPGGNTPLGVTVSVDPTGLAAGTYMGTVAVTSAAASNSPQSVGVTFTVSGGPPPTPTITLIPSALTFNSTSGGPVAPRNVQVTSNSAPLAFTTTVSTSSGANWLSVSPASGTTPATLAVSADVSGLSPGTYTGSVVFTASGASNSPLTLGVTLMVGSTQPPPTSAPPLTFNFSALDRESDGNQRLLVSGRGSVDSSGQTTGNGNFTIYTSNGQEGQQTVATGTWTASAVTSFTPATAGGGGGAGGREAEGEGRRGRTSGGILVITVNIAPMGGAPLTGTMTIANTGTQRGVTLSIDGGQTFVASGAATVSIRVQSTSGGGGDGGDTGDSAERDRAGNIRRSAGGNNN